MKTIISILLLSLASAANAADSEPYSLDYIGATNSPYTQQIGNSRALSLQAGHLIDGGFLGNVSFAKSAEVEILSLSDKTEATIGGAIHISLSQVGVQNGFIKAKGAFGSTAQGSVSYEHIISLSNRQGVMLSGGITKLGSTDMPIVQIGASLLF